MNLAKAFSSEALREAWEILLDEFPEALIATLGITIVSTLLAIVIGMPLGVLLVVGEEGGVKPLPKWLMQTLNIIVNILRSVPFLILIILVIPITRAIVGTTVGTVASAVPLVIAAFPFIARLVESSLRELNPNIIEAAQSMGASPMQIILKVMIPESLPSLINNFTLAITTILGYNAMSGTLGGEGIGKIAINYGYYRYKTMVMLIAVAVLVLLVQVFQSVGTALATRSDKRLKQQQSEYSFRKKPFFWILIGITAALIIASLVLLLLPSGSTGPAINEPTSAETSSEITGDAGVTVKIEPTVVRKLESVYQSEETPYALYAYGCTLSEVTKNGAVWYTSDGTPTDNEPLGKLAERDIDNCCTVKAVTNSTGEEITGVTCYEYKDGWILYEIGNTYFGIADDQMSFQIDVIVPVTLDGIPFTTFEKELKADLALYLPKILIGSPSDSQ